MRLLCVLGASEALADHLCRHPEHWRELTRPDARLDPAGGVRPARAAARGRRRRPARPVADRDAAGRRGGGRAAGGVPADPAAPGLPRPGPRPRRRRRRGRAVRPRRRHARGGTGGRAAAGGGVVLDHPAVGHRDGQVRRARAQLRLRRGRHLRLRAGRRRRRRGRRRGPPRSWPASSCRSAPTRPARARSGRSTPTCAPRARPGSLVRTLASHRGYYERWASTWEFQALLKARPVAGDLALGREYVAMVVADGVERGRARRLRRRHPGDAPPGARPHPGPPGRAADQARLGRPA